jgi:predicted nucleic acid-binding protein
MLHLAEANAGETLRLIGDIHAPPRVLNEMFNNFSGWQTPSWIKIDTLDQRYAAEAAAWLDAELLHAGEAEAIALARQINADWLLTDDAAARLFASELGLEVHGSLGIILWAAANGFFDYMEAAAVLSRLASSSLWLSRRVMAEAQAALLEIYRPGSVP